MSTEVIKEYYQDSAVAQDYDRERFGNRAGRLFDRVEKGAIRKILRHVPLKPSLSAVLDVPCGTGRITEVLLDMGFHVTGADISREMIDMAEAKCRRFGGQVRFCQMDLDAADLPEDRFDLVTCIRMLHHLDTGARRRILAALARMSRGYVLVNVSYSSPFYRIRRRIKRWLGQGVSRESSTWRNILEEAEHAGLKVEKTQFIWRYLSENRIILFRKINSDGFGE